MASGKEIRTKIASVKSTQKITKAMQMVAASRPYAERIKTVIGHLSEANPDYRHPYLQAREIKRIGYIVISTDRGLCGSVNVNMFREVLRDLRQRTFQRFRRGVARPQAADGVAPLVDDT